MYGAFLRHTVGGRSVNEGSTRPEHGDERPPVSGNGNNLNADWLQLLTTPDLGIYLHMVSSSKKEGGSPMDTDTVQIVNDSSWIRPQTSIMASCVQTTTSAALWRCKQQLNDFGIKHKSIILA